MANITKDEFLQGVAFTHKETKQLYSSLKYRNEVLNCVNIDYSTNPIQTEYSVKNITKSSFDIKTVFFDSLETKTVLFEDCFRIENQPKANEKC